MVNLLSFVFFFSFIWPCVFQPLQLVPASRSCPPGKQADQLAAGACKVQQKHTRSLTDMLRLCNQYLNVSYFVADTQ